MERHEVSSTSKAAEIVAKQGTTSAAIASYAAGTVHGLDVLAANIEDTEDNKTRFLIISRGRDRSGGQQSKPREKSLFSFTVDQSCPGALADALSVFNPHGLDLRSVNSRPSGRQPWQYAFLVELTAIGDRGGSVQAACKDLASITTEWRWLGTWPNQLKT